MHTSYFIGVELPSSIGNAITTAQAEIDPQTSHIAPLQPHITLINPDVLGAVSPLYYKPIVKEVAESFLPLQIELNDFGIFNERILYIAVESIALNALQAALVARLPEHVQAEYFVGKEFTAHVTVAQVRGEKLKPEIIAAYKAKLESLLPIAFQVNSLTKFTREAPRQYKTKTI